VLRTLRQIVLTLALGTLVAACGQVVPPTDADGRLPPAPPGAGEPVPPGEDPGTPPGAGEPPGPGTARVARGPDGDVANDESAQPAINHDGRFVAFASPATNLVAEPTNGVWQVYLRDRHLGTVELVSVSTDGAAADGNSTRPALSDDGRFVAFASDATNLVTGIDNGVTDVYVRDRQLGRTELVSLADGGTRGDGESARGAISPDGRYVAFESEATTFGAGPGAYLRDRDAERTLALPTSDASDATFPGRFFAATTDPDWTAVVLRDRVTGSDAPLGLALDGGGPNRDTIGGPASLDGRFVVVTSLANNLVDVDWTTEGWNVFRHDRATGGTEMVSVAVDGRSGDDFSLAGFVTADGRHVAFASLADNLVDEERPLLGWSLYVRDMETGLTRRVPVSTGPISLSDFFEYVVSGDGRHVAFTYRATFVADDPSEIGGVETIDAHPDGVYEVFVHTFERGP
jgi:Tol biopolymer transport system component